jgi:myo-inositol-1-phosphate synthase
MSDSIVHRAPVLDGVAEHMKNENGFLIDDSCYLSSKDEIIKNLKDLNVEILINYLPVGSQIATEFWANVCLETGISFCNCIPVFIASDPIWEKKFYEKNIPIIGDDMRSQFGASVLSQMLQELAVDRGHIVICHIQQNVGGNTDFCNMLDKSRLASKKISKENVIRSQNVIRNVDDSDSFLFAGPSDYIKFYKDNKIAYLHLELEGFGGAPVTLDAKLSVQDSPNSAGVVIDAVRFLKVARDLKLKGSLRGPSAFTQKTPPEQLMFYEAKNECDKLAKGELTERIQKQNT